TPIGYRITPAGKQVKLGDLPLAAALTPDGQSLLVSNDGQAVQSLEVIDVRSGSVRQTLTYQRPEALFTGIAVSADGRPVFASAGGNNKIRTYDMANGRLTETAPLALPTTTPGGQPVNLYPAGIALTPDGQRLVVADQLGDAVTVIDISAGTTHTAAAG